MTSTKTSSRSIYAMGMVLLCALLVAPVAQAQNLVNGATGKISNYGTITFNDDNGEFRNSNATLSDIDNQGTFRMEGTDNKFTDGTGDEAGATALGNIAAFRIPGTVEYAGAGAPQTVGAVSGTDDRFYTNLTLSGTASKNIADNVYVGAVYAVTGGDRTYNGTFHYDGSVAQTIFAESGAGPTNAYNNLDILGSTKTINAAETVNVLGGFTSAADGPLALNGILNLGTGASTADGTITLNDAGAELNMGTGNADFNADLTNTLGAIASAAGSGDMTIGASATLSLANAAGSTLNMGAGTNLFVTGAYTNAFAATGTNQTFDATSTVDYNGAGSQTIVPTVASNPYGNLTIENAAKIAGGNIEMAGNLDISGGDLDMTVAATQDYRLTMQSAGGTATYTGNTEVVGEMRRDLTGGALATTYVFNNENMQVTFASGTLPNNLTIDSRPQTSPNNYDLQRDVNRKITFEYANNSTDWDATIRAGWKAGDVPGSWIVGYTEDQVRFYESGAGTKKIATGEAYSRNTATPIRYAELAGIRPTGSGAPAREIMASADDLLLRSGPSVFHPIAHGRWSNPDTWDEGIEPSSIDEVVIDGGFNVHAGYVRANDNYAIAEASPLALAASITIANEANSILLFGGSTSFSMPVSSTVTNERLTATVPTAASLTTEDATASILDGGLFIYNGTSFKTNTFVNNGTVAVGPTATLEIGD